MKKQTNLDKKSTLTSVLLFTSDSSDVDYKGTVILNHADNYAFYIFIGTTFNLTSIIHASTLKKRRGTQVALVSYYGRDLFAYVSHRRYWGGFLHSFWVDDSGVRRIYGVKIQQRKM